MLPAEQTGCCSGKAAVEAMWLWWMFTVESRKKQMWMEEETNGT